MSIKVNKRSIPFPEAYTILSQITTTVSKIYNYTGNSFDTAAKEGEATSYFVTMETHHQYVPFCAVVFSVLRELVAFQVTICQSVI